MISAPSKIYLANVFIKSKKFAEAEKILISLIEIDPLNYKYHYNLSIVYSEQLKVKSAIEYFNNALALAERQIIDGNDLKCLCSDIHGNLAALHIKDLDPTKAEKHCRLGLEYDRFNRICLHNMNICLRQLNRLKEAIKLSWISSNLTRPHTESYTDEESTNVSYTSNTDTAKIIFVCVKWGIKYSSDYVNRLYYALMENSSEPLGVMMCYTDDPTGIHPDILCIPFEAASKEWTGWWLKAAIFKNAEINGQNSNDWCVYIDLDTVICNSIDFLLTHIRGLKNNSFCTLSASKLSSEGRSDGINSSLMIWRRGSWSCIYHFLLINYRSILNCTYKFDHFLEMILLNYENEDGDVTESFENVDYLNKFDNKIVDYRDIVQYCSNIDKIATHHIICFPLKPKPHEIDNEFINKYWRDIIKS